MPVATLPATLGAPSAHRAAAEGTGAETFRLTHVQTGNFLRQLHVSIKQVVLNNKSRRASLHEAIATYVSFTSVYNR